MGAAAGEELGSFDVAIVGAGPIGAACALEAVRRGARVAVLEAGGGWGSECVAASAGWVCPSFAGPFVRRGELLQAARWLTRGDSPLAIALSPSLVPWLWTLLRRSDQGSVDRVAGVLGDLASASAESHRQLVREGIDTGLRVSGLLDVYSTRGDYEAGRVRVDALQAAGLRAEPMGPDGIPGLPRTAAPPAGAILYPEEAVCPPSRFVEALGAAAERQGARLYTGGRVDEVARAGREVLLRTGRGTVRAGTAVVCAGSAAPALVGRDARVPIVGGRGYAVEVARSRPVADPGPLVYLHEQRVAVTPWRDAIRFAGTLELGRAGGPPTSRRVDGIVGAARRAFPDLAWGDDRQLRSGARPCTPDGLPVVGRLDPRGQVIVAAGHAMLGLTLAPITGALVGSLLDGGPPDPRLEPLSPGRFRQGRWGRS